MLIPPAEESAALPETGADSSANMLLVLLAIGAGLVVLGILLRPVWLDGDSV